MESTYLMLTDLFVGLLMAGLAIPMIKGKVKPNRWYGFRTPKTLSSEEIWYPANRYAGKAVLYAGIAIAVISGIFLLLAGSIKTSLSVSQGTILIIWGTVLFIPIIAMVIASFRYLKKL